MATGYLQHIPQGAAAHGRALRQRCLEGRALGRMGKPQCSALYIGQGMQHAGVEVIQAMQVEVIGVLGLITSPFLDQHFKDWSIGCAHMVEQRA